MFVQNLSLLLLALFHCSHGMIIPLNSQCLENPTEIDENERNASMPSCLSLDEALVLLESDDTLILSPGIYTLRKFSTEVVRDISNVSIIGDPTDPRRVTITCSESVGLFFFNVSELTISGVTVERCGIKGVDRIGEIVNMTGEIIDLLYSPLPDFSSALLMIHCPNLQLSDVVIRDNRGFGLVGINLIGSTTFHRVHLLQNYPLWCVIDLQRYSDIGGSGGGAFLIYQDYVGVWQDQFRRTSVQFHFSESNITDNFVCRLNLFHVLHDKLPRSINNPQAVKLSLIGAGGVTLSMAQSTFQVSALFESCIFRNNSGTYNGAAMHVSQFELSNDSHVFIERSTFVENGAELVRQHGEKGLAPTGALHISFYIPNPLDYGNRHLARRLLSQEPSSVVISHSSFTGNVARSGAGLCVISFGPEIGVIQDSLVLNNTVFTYNQADFGGAIYIAELSYGAFERGLSVFFSNLNVSRNLKRDVFTLNSVHAASGIIDINFLNFTIKGDNYIGHNNDTAISLYSAIATLSGTILMEYNTGSTGGAIDVTSESYLILTGSTNITFHRNTALIAGGAIHVNFDSTRSNTYDCFVFFSDPDFFCDLFERCGDELVFASFIDNRAPLGSTLYGSTFSNCPWAGGMFDADEVVRGAQEIIQRFASYEPFIKIRPAVNTSQNIVNTLPRTIIPRESDLNFTIMPGKMLEADLGAFDELNQSVPLTVYSQLTLVEGKFSINSRAFIGATNRYLINAESNFTTVPIQVYGAENSTYNVTITSTEAQVAFTFRVNLQHCTIGFVYNETSQACDCKIHDTIEGVSCENDGTITFPMGPWIGYIEEHGFVTRSCTFDYCIRNVTRIALDDPDSQCMDNRAGILCGQCKVGYSRVLGSPRCLECNNNNLALTIAFAFLGILLVVMISLLNFTITDGYINGMIFYCNIASLYLNLPLPMPLVFVSLVNLYIGIEACFYDGMTELHLALLSLIFPLYLGAILLVITTVSKYCHNKHFAKLLNKMSITHVFATLLLFSYTSIIQTCIGILSYITIQLPDGGTLTVWTSDPGQKYLHGLHIFEFIVAIFLIIVLLPFPLLLLFPQKSLRLPYLSRLKPLIDAFVAPLADGRSFWIGFRLLSRVFFFLLLVLLPEEPRNITICIFLILITVLDAYIKPFRTASRNLVDLFFMVNLTIFSFLVVVAKSGAPPIATYVAVGLIIAFGIVTLILLIYYVLVALPFTERVKEKVGSFEFLKKENILLWFKDCSKTRPKAEMKKKAGPTSMATHTSFSLNNDFVVVRATPANSSPRYRESLFEQTSS